MTRADRASLILFLGGSLFFIDMFLHWTRFGGSTINGWQLQVVPQAGLLALVLVELTRLGGIWLTRTSALLGGLLGAATGILIVGGLVNFHWGAYADLKFSSFGYAAWIGLAAAVVLLGGASLRLAELR